MSAYERLLKLFYRAVVYTVLRPIRDQAFHNTRKAKISTTEQEALSSGSVGFEGEILSGQPDWRRLMDMPPPQLSPEEKAFLDGPVEKLCDMLDDWKIRNELRDLPPDIWEFLKKNRFFGMIIPKKYDGLGFSAQAHSEVILKLASRSTTACVTAMVPNSLGPAELLIHYGTEEQKNHYLPRLARGEEIPSFALTEPNAGSDASSMTSQGVVCEQDGKLGIRLNWDKRYITLSPISTLLGLAFKLYDPDGLLGEKTELGITLALIPIETTGVTAGRRHDPLGIPFQNGPTSGEDVWIPLDYIIGGQDYAGKGWRMLMECLSVGRCISLPALSTGCAKLVCRIAGAYSRVRKQFKVPIGKFEGVEELLARIAGTTYMMEAARLATLQMLDRGETPTIISAILKYHMTESARLIVNDGMDILGGKAICEGPGNLISPLYHSIPIGITVEGANLLTRNMIIFGQASVRSHPFVLKEMEAAKMDDIDEARRQFSFLMADHVHNSVKNGLNSFLFGLLDGRFSRIPQCSDTQKRYFQQINRLSAAFATVTDMTLMLLGDSVKRKERISALLGDIMSHLYLASCTLRHFNSQQQQAEDLPLMHWACQEMLYRAEESMDKLLQNFPNPWMGLMLRLAVFPLGRRFKHPSHKLDRQVAKALYNPGTLRDRLTCGIYIPEHESESLAILEKAFDYTITAEQLENRLQKARKEGILTNDAPGKLLLEAVIKEVLTSEEADYMIRAEDARRKVIQVDDFESDFGSTQEKLPALADEKALRTLYPTGTRWNMDIPKQDLVQLLDETVARYEKRPCMDFLGKKYTYREFDELVNRATAGLQEMGVTPGTKIGLYMPNTPYYPIMFFAALRAGATIVNFCPLYTLAGLREQALDSDTRILITMDLKELYDKAAQLQEDGTLAHVIYCRMEDALPFFKAQAYRIMKGAQIARPEDSLMKNPDNREGYAPIVCFKDLINTLAAVRPITRNPDDVAVLQYTGGTTGSPKGAMLTHYNLIANVAQIQEYFKVSADKPDSKVLLKSGKERVLVSIPFFHVFGMTVAMLHSLKMGSELIILPDPRNMKETLKTIQEKRPTLFPSVPRLLQAISENPKVGSFDLSSLETVISGGAALSANSNSAFEEVTQQTGLIKQGYGLTEAAPVATSNPPFGINRPESVGLPVPQTRIKITDPENPDNLLKIGEIGEICISGPQVMKGYYNREAETRAVFHHGWLRTGDLGYLDEDYYLHIVDRQKRLILVSGFSVYPTQIELAICKHPAVAECMVISVPDIRSGEAVKAFIRFRPDVHHKPTAHQMHDFLEDLLSRVELPKHIEFVHEELPKTAVGKPDWKGMQEKERVHYEDTEKIIPMYDLKSEQA